MKFIFPRSVFGTLVIGVGLASFAFGDPTVTPFQLTSAGPAQLGSVYTSPYMGKINGGPQEVPIICDDFADENQPSQSWTALVTDLSAFNGVDIVKTVYYNPGPMPSAQKQTNDYIAVAILSEKILNDAPGTERNDLSYALWAIFDPAALNAPLPGSDSSAAAILSANALSAASYYASGAAYEAATATSVTIYTPTLNNTNPAIPDTSGTRPQEFVTVPEPSTLAVLGLDVAGAGILGLFFRRRKRSSIVNS